MNRIIPTLLEFKPELNKFGKEKELRCGLSAVVQVGDTLWVANDETVTLERLSFQATDSNDAYKCGNHEPFRLGNYLTLPADESKGKEKNGEETKNKKKIVEVDVEGLDYKDSFLWLVGSHSLKRKKPDPQDEVEDNFRDLAEVKRDGNRYLLARIPLVEKDGTYTLEQEIDQNGKKLTAGQLRGNATGNALIEALAQDSHLQPFLALPGKDNGFDIEGLAVGDEGRIFLGLRGPVLRGWAVILELQVEADQENPAELRLKPINPKNRSNITSNPTYRKHFLNLGGLGIRDLCCDGNDLLILAGPTMELDGPVAIFRWKGGTRPEREHFVASDALQKVVDVPFGRGKDQGKDHAEGMTLFSSNGGMARSILVVYDAPSDDRLEGVSTVRVDILALPK